MFFHDGTLHAEKRTRPEYKIKPQKETAMKSIISNSVGILLMIAGSAFAGTGAAAEENGWLWMLFLGFAALVVVFQLVPSVILLGAMLKELFSPSVKENPNASETNGNGPS
jgi:uncharacterized membrane protein